MRCGDTSVLGAELDRSLRSETLEVFSGDSDEVVRVAAQPSHGVVLVTGHGYHPKLQTKVREDFTITGEASTKAFSWLNMPNSATASGIRLGTFFIIVKSLRRFV